jgi:hypothetical protein
MRLVLSSSLLAVLVVTVAESAFEQQQFQTFTRYGKRGVAESEGGRQLFFTNSRYGKRAPGPMGTKTIGSLLLFLHSSPHPKIPRSRKAKIFYEKTK